MKLLRRVKASALPPSFRSAFRRLRYPSRLIPPRPQFPLTTPAGNLVHEIIA
jgi:hypothetical protein